MPNSQTHLFSVCHLLKQSNLLDCVPWLKDDAARSAFLLGSISPDVRVVSGQAREDTHFFSIPIPPDAPSAQENMLREYPVLRDLPASNQRNAAFVAGYITHLVMDQTWLEIVVMPGIFVDGEKWGLSHPNWRLYSILMTYLEYRAEADLPDGTVELMHQAQPDHWLPFTADKYLIAWRDRAYESITKGGAKLLSTLFARSNDMTPDEMETIVTSEEHMALEAYHDIQRDWLQRFETETNQRSLEAVLDYLCK